MKKENIILISSVVLYIIIMALFVVIDFKPVINYTAAFIASSLLFIFICMYILKHDIPAKLIIALAVVGIAVRIAFIPIHPVGSDDYYRYVWDGKVMAAGVNPYAYAPDSPALNSLHTDILPKRVNFPGMKTIYPPLSEELFFVSYMIGGESFLGIKLLLLLFDLASILGLYLILKKLKLPVKNILIYVLCPLPVFQFFLDGHVDGFGLPLLIFSLFFYLDNKKLLGYIFLGLSVCIKPLGLILLPIYFFNEEKLADKFKSAAVPIAVVAAMYLPFISGGAPFQALVKFTENWTFNGAVFDILDSFIHDNQRTRLICGILLMLSYLPVILSRKDILTKIYISIFLLFIFSPVVHPWYLTWLAVLLPFIPRESGIAYVSLVSLTAFTILNYQLYGIWKDYPLVMIAEYLPAVSLFIYEMYKMKTGGKAFTA